MMLKYYGEVVDNITFLTETALLKIHRLYYCWQHVVELQRLID